MDERIQNAMDEIMEKMHQVSWYLIELGKIELSGKKISKEQIEKNKFISKLFEQIQEKYRLIYDFIIEKTETDEYYNEQLEELIGDFAEILKSINETSISEGVEYNINKIRNYLQKSYIDLRYIGYYQGKRYTPSIYEKTDFATIRNTEFTLQQDNLQNIILRAKVTNSLDKLSFSEKNIILVSMSVGEFYNKYAIEQIDEYIQKLDKKQKELPEEEYKEGKKKLIESKYTIYYEYFNNKYNGILQENDKGTLGIAKKLIDDGAEKLALNMTDFEISENINANIKELKKELNQKIKTYLAYSKLKAFKNTSAEKDIMGIDVSDDSEEQR